MATVKSIMIDVDTNCRMENQTKNGTYEQMLPQNCLPLHHQVAGHFFGKGRTKLGNYKEPMILNDDSIFPYQFYLTGFLQTDDGCVLKPVQSPPRGEREHNFFKRIFKSNQSDLNEDEQELKKLLPNYRGSFVHNESKLLDLKINLKLW